MNLNREINLNKKVIVFLIFICIISISTYYSYALFQVNDIKHNAIILKTATSLDITTKIDDTDSDTFTLGNTPKTITVKLDTNGITSAMAYKMYYEVEGSVSFNVTSTETFTNNEIEGIMQPYERTNGEKITGKEITLTFTNNTENDLTIKLGAIGGFEVKGVDVGDRFRLLIGENKTETVTFDYGDENIQPTTKQVAYHSNYGTLPEPTREGYTFKGWNGKNLLDINEATNQCLVDNNDGTYTMWKNDEGRISKELNIFIPNNTTFTISYVLLEYNASYLPLQFVSTFSDNTGENMYAGTTKSGGTWTKEKDIIKLVIYQEGSLPIGTYTKFKNIQLEEGGTATEYEPYYITSNTKVVQNGNHTLKAIWEENVQNNEEE